VLTLGIESSCDDTGLALYDETRGLLAHVLFSQTEMHVQFGGVVPELASRDHVRKILPLLKSLLNKAHVTLDDIEGIAYTRGPGLAGALLTGAAFAKSLAMAQNLPCIGINHLEGHLLAPMLEDTPPAYPFLALLVSGGHTQLIFVKQFGHYELLGESLDDAAGEAFDKTGRLLGLPYPAGPEIAKLALKGTPDAFHFPRPMTDRPGLDFSFSGLKTSILYAVKETDLTEQRKADIAHACQVAIVDTLVIKCRRAIKQTNANTLVIAGGVSANKHLRDQLTALSQKLKISLFYPRPEFCTDNGAMIAYAGNQRLRNGEKDNPNIDIKPRWPISELT
jgi:N6-L-threonylcarbamoyladenine synthase